MSLKKSLQQFDRLFKIFEFSDAEMQELQRVRELVKNVHENVKLSNVDLVFLFDEPIKTIEKRYEKSGFSKEMIDVVLFLFYGVREHSNINYVEYVDFKNAVKPLAEFFLKKTEPAAKFIYDKDFRFARRFTMTARIFAKCFIDEDLKKSGVKEDWFLDFFVFNNKRLNRNLDDGLEGYDEELNDRAFNNAVIDVFGEWMRFVEEVGKIHKKLFPGKNSYHVWEMLN